MTDTHTYAVELARKIYRLVVEKKARQISVLEAAELVSYTDIMMIMTSGSDRHTRALADHVVETLKKEKIRPLGVEGYSGSKWILIDYGEVVVHIMQKEAREYYDLDGLWQEAPSLDF